MLFPIEVLKDHDFIILHPSIWIDVKRYYSVKQLSIAEKHLKIYEMAYGAY